MEIQCEHYLLCSDMYGLLTLFWWRDPV